MVDRITRSNSIRNTLCCCFYYLCLWLSFVRLPPLLLHLFSFVCCCCYPCCRKLNMCAWVGVGVGWLLWGLLLHKKKMVCKVTHSRTVQVCVCVSVCIPLCMCASGVVCVRFLRLFIFMMFPFWHFIEEVYRRHCCCCINK